MKIKSLRTAFDTFEVNDNVAEIKESSGKFFLYDHDKRLVLEIRLKDVIIEYYPQSQEKRETKKSKMVQEYSDDIVSLVEKFIELLIFNNPKVFIPTDLSKWNNEMYLLLANDKYSYDDVMKIIEYSQTDNFWKPIILTIPKLRQKRDTLLQQANRKLGGGYNKLREIAEGKLYEPTGSSKVDTFTFD